MGGGGVEIASDAAPPGEGGERMPLAGDGLVALGGFGAALGDVGRPVHGEIAGEQEDLLFVAAQPAAQRVAGVVPVLPVPQPVVDDPEGGGLVVALAELVQHLRAEGGAAAGAGVLDGLVRFAQDLDDVAGPGLQAAGAELGDRPASSDDVLVIPISG